MDWETILYETNWEGCSKKQRNRVGDLMKRRFDTEYIRKTREGNLIPAPLMRDDHIRNALNYSLKCALGAVHKKDWQHFEFRCRDISGLLYEVVRRGHSVQSGKYDCLMIHYLYLYDDLPFTTQAMECCNCSSSSKYYIPHHRSTHRDEDSSETVYMLHCPDCMARNYLSFDSYECGAYITWNREIIPGSSIYLDVPDHLRH